MPAHYNNCLPHKKHKYAFDEGAGNNHNKENKKHLKETLKYTCS
jgi:hypothetical protein